MIDLCVFMIDCVSNIIGWFGGGGEDGMNYKMMDAIRNYYDSLTNFPQQMSVHANT